MAVSASVAKQSQHINLLLLMLLNVLAFSAPSAVASANDHRFNVGEHVPIFVNKVGPFNNPRYHLPIQHPDSTSFGSISPIACTQFVYQNVQYIPPQSMLMNDLLPCDLFTSRRPFNALETYQYYDIPFCRPEPVIQKQESIGEVLNGDRLTNTLYKLNFREEKALETLCQKKLNVAEIAKFRDAVINDFYFQMYYDDLPMWAFIGRVEDESWTLRENGPKYYLFKHVQFDVLYKGNQVIEIQAFSDPNHVLDITEDVETDVKFTYSVNWSETSVSFDSRMNKYAKASLLPIRQKIHWFSFINSIVIIVLLMGLLTLLIMQRLKNDLRKSSNGDEEEDKEVGWKYIHGDVFRYPSNLSLFCAVLGTGTQLLTLVCILFLLAFFGVLYPYNRGALFTSLVLVYTITSVVAGYTAAAFHNQFSETRWVRSVLLTGTLYLGPLLVTVFIVNMVAVAYGATAALPFGTFVVILLIYMFIAIPLLALGGLIGYRFRSEFQAPCATKQYPREIPPLAWYRKTPCQMFIGGLLPFSAILIQLHHLYASIWGYKIYTLPGILFITFVILVVLTAILSVGLTYIQLSVEDHKWWWRSMLSGGSTAFFTFGYGIYLYLRSNMKGFMQLFSFIGYTACMSYAIFLMLATISFHASLMFVRYIYRAVKSE